jgi:hypothetical protein
MKMSDLKEGTKDPKSVAGAPFPPAVRHEDGQRDRERRSVPSSAPKKEELDRTKPSDPTDIERREEEDGA